MHPGHRGDEMARNTGSQSFGTDRVTLNRTRSNPRTLEENRSGTVLSRPFSPQALRSARGFDTMLDGMNKTLSISCGVVVSLLAAGATAVVAMHRAEPINALWLVVAATCCYALGYRFYSKFIAAKILALDALRATPAERLENGRDFPGHEQVGRIRTPLRRHRGTGTPGRASARCTVRIPSRNALGAGGSRLCRLRTGLRDPPVLCPPRRQIPHGNGQGRDRGASVASSPTPQSLRS